MLLALKEMKLSLVICIVTAAIFHYSVAGLVGGWSDVSDVNSSNFQKIVSVAAEKITKASNSIYLFKPVEVLNARRQVVSGMNYKFTLRLAATECKKNKSKNLDASECKLLHCGPIESCNVTVWYKPWEGMTKITEQSCRREPKSC